MQATIKFAGAAPTRVRPLDIYGVAGAKSVAVKSDGSFAIDGTFASYYYEVQR